MKVGWVGVTREVGSRKGRQYCGRDQGPWRGQCHGRGWGGGRSFRQGQSRIQEMGAADVLTDQSPRRTQLQTGSPRRRCHGSHSRLSTPVGRSQGPPSPARRHTALGADTARGRGSPPGTGRSGRRR